MTTPPAATSTPRRRPTPRNRRRPPATPKHPATPEHPAARASGDTYEADEYVDALVEEIGGDEEARSASPRRWSTPSASNALEASGVTPEDFVATGSPRRDRPGPRPIGRTGAAGRPRGMPEPDRSVRRGRRRLRRGDRVREREPPEAQIAELFVVQFMGGTPSQDLIDAQTATQACMDRGRSVSKFHRALSGPPTVASPRAGASGRCGAPRSNRHPTRHRGGRR